MQERKREFQEAGKNLRSRKSRIKRWRIIGAKKIKPAIGFSNQ